MLPKKALSQPTSIATSYTTFLDWFIIVGSIFVWDFYPNLWTFILATLIVGNRQHALSVIGHDAAHYLWFKSTRLNDLVGNLFIFWPLFSDIDSYRRFHFKHHRFTGRPNDPEYEHKLHGRQKYLDAHSWKSVMRVFFLDLVGGGILEVLALPKVASAGSMREKLAPVLALSTILILSTITSGVWIWVVALFTSHWAFFRIRIWTEHFGTRDTHRLDAPTLVSWFLFPHNVLYHYEHHTNPTIPWKHLPVLREQTWDEKPVVPWTQLFSLVRKEDIFPYAPSLENLPIKQ